MTYLSVGCIVKDEAPYLPEWVAFHRLIGVQHFYLYDNGSRVPVRDTLAVQVAEGLVTVVDYPGHARQLDAYLDCVGRAKESSEWLVLFDCDEFLFPTVEGNLLEILKDYQAYGGLAVNALFYGSSGHLTRPGGLQIESFTRRTPDQYGPNRTIKTIVRPRCVSEVPSPHWVRYREGSFCVNEGFVPVQGPMADVSVSKLRINHYYTRSAAEWKEKLARGSATGITKGHELFDAVDSYCDVTDTLIVRYAARLRERLGLKAPGP